MSFDYPWVLWGFAALFPLALIDFFRLRLQAGTLPPALKRRLWASAFFINLFLSCLVFALASPRWGTGRQSDGFRRGLDVVIALDVSRSMDVCDIGARAADGGQSRLERGLELSTKVVSQLPELRFAAAIGRTRGLLTVPLTWDSNTVLSFLEAVSGESFNGRSTNLEALLDAAVQAFQDNSPGRRVILLVSDGESLSGSLRLAVDRLIKQNVAVVALGLGSETGSPVPGLEETISRQDAAALRMAADRTGGIYVDGNSKDALNIMTDYLRSLAPVLESGRTGFERKQRWFLFVLAGIISYGLSKLCLLEKVAQRRARVET